MVQFKRYTSFAVGAVLMLAISAMASYNITFDQSKLRFLTADDFKNGVTVSGKNTG